MSQDYGNLPVFMPKLTASPVPNPGDRIPCFRELVGSGFLVPAPEDSILTLEEARYYVGHNLDNGVRCPCCRQYAKRYARKLNSGMARVLVLLCGLSRDRGPWISIKQLETTSREVHKLAYWDLVVADKNHAPDKKHSGSWCPTPKAYEFIWGKIRVPERVIVYNNVVEGFEGEPLAIWQALGRDFDYQELMQTTPGLIQQHRLFAETVS